MSPPRLALAGALLILLALTFGAASVLVVGLGLLLTAILAPALGALSARSLSVRRRLTIARVQEDEPVQAYVEVRRGLLPAREIVLCDPLAGGERALTLPRGRRPVRFAVEASFPRRGRHTLPPASLRVSDPLGLCRFRRHEPGAGLELLVLPRTEPVAWEQAGRRGNWAGEQVGDGGDPPAAVEVDGIRPYRPGTPASRIHWATLARGAGLMERRLRADGAGLPLVVLDPGGGPHPDRLDAAVRAAASLTLALARRRGCRLFVPGTGPTMTVTPDLAGWENAHAVLATVQAHGTRASGQAAPPVTASMVLLVRAAPPGAGASEPGPRILVMPDSLWPEGSPLPQLRTCGCRGYAVAAPAALAGLGHGAGML